MKGKIEAIGPIENVSSGSGKKGPWILWSAKVNVDGNEYGYSDFEKKDLEAKCAKLKVGSTVEFETEENKGGFTNVKRKTEIKVLEEGKGAAGPAPAGTATKKKPSVPFMEDKEVFALMDKCIEAVNDSLSKQKIAVQSLDETTTMINSVFIACREERKGARRWA